MNEVVGVIVPKDTVSDDRYLITEHCVAEGDAVKADDAIAVLETSKAALTVTSPADGCVFFHGDVGDTVPVGGVLAVIAASAEQAVAYLADHGGSTPQTAEAPGDVRFSSGAADLIAQLGVDTKAFAGMGLVRKRDVEQWIAARERPGDESEIAEVLAGENSVIVLGGGGHGKMCIDILKQMAAYEPIGVIDATLARETTVLGLPVLGKDTPEAMKALHARGVRLAVNGIGALQNRRVREATYRKLKDAGFEIPNIIHPTAAVEPSVRMGDGNQIMANAAVGSDVEIGSNCVINAGALVSHDCVLGDNVHAAPGAILGGGVVVGANSLIGMGATVFLEVCIGDNAQINNGANVFKDVPASSVVKASPGGPRHASDHR
ncbi:MAG: NeuD/PglB/VioB family sugar acetyltransferase [Gemmatimonadetes bacterium]|nr:NeuD/PglB/VioB family sugar acetyltransferase [Gemmatimonadota bacterium]